MDEKHKLLIEKNFTELVQRADLNKLLSKLITKGVYTTRIAAPYLDHNKTLLDRKRDLFFHIHRRGPEAFDKLVASFREIGDEEHRILANLLEEKETAEMNPQRNNNESNHGSDNMKEASDGASCNYNSRVKINSRFIFPILNWVLYNQGGA